MQIFFLNVLSSMISAIIFFSFLLVSRKEKVHRNIISEANRAYVGGGRKKHHGPPWIYSKSFQLIFLLLNNLVLQKQGTNIPRFSINLTSLCFLWQRSFINLAINHSFLFQSFHAQTIRPSLPHL